jgi:hypothetical protein
MVVKEKRRLIPARAQVQRLNYTGDPRSKGVLVVITAVFVLGSMGLLWLLWRGT